MTELTALLVDDEANLLEYLERQLKTAWPELKIVGTALNGRQALAAIAETQPDILFLDIHMPGLNGLQVAEQVGEQTQIVFVTAFDQYAVEAFESAAVDYLLKPVTADRLQQTRERITSRTRQPDHSELKRLLKNLDSGEEYLQWLRAGKGETVRLIPVTDAVYFKADHKYTSIFTADEEHIIRMSIKDLEGQLNPDKFWRIHRGLIVQVEDIVEAKRDLRGRYTLKLRSRAEKIKTSQAYGHLFKQM